MSWANCGNDSMGRPIGYAHPAKCDQEGCEAEIDRGLSYACGGMHGNTEIACEKYFCEEHLANFVIEDEETCVCVCTECAALLKASGEWVEDEEEGTIVRKPTQEPQP